MAVSSLYSGSNSVQLLEIKLRNAKLPLVSEGFLFGKLQRTSYLYICGDSTLRKVTLVQQHVQCCKTNEHNAAGQHLQHTAVAATQQTN